MLVIDRVLPALNYLMTMAAAPIRDSHRHPTSENGLAQRRRIQCPPSRSSPMDLIRLLKSLEELIYELVSWLVFYPVTMWRSIVNPQEMMRYAQSDCSKKSRTSLPTR